MPCLTLGFTTCKRQKSGILDQIHLYEVENCHWTGADEGPETDAEESEEEKKASDQEHQIKPRKKRKK